MVLVLGVSAGASGARAILTHSDQPELPPIDHCVAPRRAGAGIDEPVLAAIEQLHRAAVRRGELISATAVACRTKAMAQSIRLLAPRLTPANQLHTVGEAEAQLRYLSFVDRIPTDGAILIYDLGSSGLTLTMADCASHTVLGAHRSTVLSGDGCDALLQWQLARLGVVLESETARRHRETLSVDRVVSTEDRKTGKRLVYTSKDFAEAAEAGVAHSVSSIHRLIEETGTMPTAMAMTGGCSRSWHLVEMLRAKLDLPILVEPEPEFVSARGAVLSAVVRPARAVRVPKALRVTPTETTPALSRRKLIAALAATGVLGVTVTAFLLTGNSPASAGDHNPQPADSTTISTQPFTP